MAMTPPICLVTAVKPPSLITLSLPMAGDPVLAGGVGGWNEISMARMQNIVVWGSTPLCTLEVPFVLEGVGKGPGGSDSNIEPLCARLFGWGVKSRSSNEPVILRLSGPLPHMGKNWIIDDITWGAAEYASGNYRVRQEGTVHFKEYRKASVLVVRNRPAAHRYRHTTVLKADMPAGLTRVAARTLGNSGRWQEIAKLNKTHGKAIRSPHQVYVGQKLLIP
jgi:hypothetical protein